MEMESVLGFKDYQPDDVVEERSHSFKLVPWISWDEWKFVRGSLFSSTPDSVASALQRISTWRSRGCVPVPVEVSASIVEIQQKDPYFRNDLNGSASLSEETLAMLYCMAIMRLVNGVVEKTRKKNEISIGEAADAIGIPRMLIDIRHEGSHRDLPSLQLVRLASKKALDWLILYYWEPQEKAIPTQNNQTATLRKEIKRSLREVSLCLKAKQMEKLSSSHVRGKRLRQTEHLHGPSKFIFLVAGKSSRSNSKGSKKQVAKSLKNALRLYSSFSTEVVYLLLEYLLNALDSSHLTEHLGDSQSESNQTAFDDWKSVVLKMSRKEPQLLLTLTQAVLEKMETNQAMNCETDDPQPPRTSAKSRRFDLLSYLLNWIVGNLKTLNLVDQKESAETKMQKATMIGLLRRCLLASPLGNKQLMASALTLAQLTGDASLLQKLKKLSLLEQPSDPEPNSTNNTVHSLQEHYIRQGEEKLELLKQRRMKSRNTNSNHARVGSNSRWSVAKSWNPCPIGMLPHSIGFSGRLPTLDCTDNGGKTVKLPDIEKISVRSVGKREAEIGVEIIDNTAVKRAEIGADCAMQDREEDVCAEGVKGCMMIDGVWRKVGEEEMSAIASACPHPQMKVDDNPTGAT